MKKIIIIAVVVFALLASGSFYYFTGTPTYSLYKLKKAVQNHDSATFNKYVDVDRVVEGLFDTASSQMEKEMGDQNNSLGEFGITLAKGLLSSFKDQMKSEINKSIEEISTDKDNKFAAVKIKEIQKEGMAAKVTLESSDGQAIKINMTQMPGRYWRVVGMDFEDFTKLNPNAAKSEETKVNADGTTAEHNQQIIEKNIGDEVELATMKFKVNWVEEKQTLKGSFGETTTADENTKFVVMNMTATNITNDGFDFDDNDFQLIDDKGRKFDAYDDTIGNVDNYLTMRSLQPSMDETGFVVYKIPSDASGYSIQIGKKDTDEIYKVNLQ
jgi:hypothetical protein